MDGYLSMNLPSPDAGEPAAFFRDLAAILYACETYQEIYTAVCEAAPRLVDGCDHASLMLREGDKLITVAASDDTARHVDELERELHEGPCVDAIEDEAVYHDADLLDGSPWPRLAERVLAETSVRGMSGFRLQINGRKTGALNLFSDTPGRLSTTSVNEGAVLSSFVSVGLMAAASREDALTLREGLTSNREIGKAVGLMMAFHKVDDQAAFDIIRKASQDMNMKVVEVAREVIAHHNNPMGGSPSRS